MKYLMVPFFIFFLSNCSFYNDSNFWSEDVIEKKKIKKDLDKVLEKSKDLMSLSFNEYKIYINEYSEKGNYPEMNK